MKSSFGEWLRSKAARHAVPCRRTRGGSSGLRPDRRVCGRWKSGHLWILHVSQKIPKIAPNLAQSTTKSPKWRQNDPKSTKRGSWDTFGAMERKRAKKQRRIAMKRAPFGACSGPKWYQKSTRKTHVFWTPFWGHFGQLWGAFWAQIWRFFSLRRQKMSEHVKM